MKEQITPKRKIAIDSINIELETIFYIFLSIFTKNCCMIFRPVRGVKTNPSKKKGLGKVRYLYQKQEKNNHLIVDILFNRKIEENTISPLSGRIIVIFLKIIQWFFVSKIECTSALEHTNASERNCELHV